jgi:hypothetical protein
MADPKRLSFASSPIESCIEGFGGRGIMRQTVLLHQPVLMVCAVIFFVVSFSLVYISFRTSAPHVRALVGGGFFLLASLLLLWKDFAPSGFDKKAL